MRGDVPFLSIFVGALFFQDLVSYTLNMAKNLIY